MLLKATTHLSRDNWRLRIAGTGPAGYVAELRRQFPDPRIEWLGFTDRSAFYPSIDVTVVPSLWREPLGYVVIESFAAGKAVICAQSGGLTELSGLGKKVKTYPRMDLHALVEAMEEALANREVWRGGGFKTLDAKVPFMRETITRRYGDLYRNADVRCSEAETCAF